jgi:hypothetical protein
VLLNPSFCMFRRYLLTCLFLLLRVCNFAEVYSTMRSSRPGESGALDSDNVNSLSRHDTLSIVCSAKEIWVEVGYFKKRMICRDEWTSLKDWQ